MKKYHKIQTVWLRDPETNFKALLDGQWAKEEFRYLRDANWDFTEKIDGTNIRIIWDGETVDVRGKSDRAHLPQHIEAYVREREGAIRAQIPGGGFTLYGEGYGPKIQSGGDYRDEQEVILFDVFHHDTQTWLKYSDVHAIAAEAGFACAPLVSVGPLSRGIEMCRGGFASQVSVRPRQAEGLIARPATPLLNRRGERIITKIKCKDFR